MGRGAGGANWIAPCDGSAEDFEFVVVRVAGAAIFFADKSFPFSELTAMMRQVGLEKGVARSTPDRKCENSETKRRLSS